MRKTAAYTAGASLSGIGLGMLGYGLIHAHSYRLRRRSILVPGRHVEPLRILHISDAHTLAHQATRLTFIRDLADTHPDLVVLTGDMISATTALDPVLEVLDPLLDVPGVFVFGSNDYVAPTFKNPLRYLLGHSGLAPDEEPPSEKRDVELLPWRDMRDTFEARGWIDLTNARAQLTVAGWDLDFVGVDDPHMNYDQFPAPQPLAHGVLQPGTDASGSSRPHARIGLTHAPYQRVLDQMVADGCSLIFSGHTHGGQVCLPGEHAIVSNCDLNPRLASGLFQWPPDPSEAPIKGDGAVIAKDGEGSAWLQVSAGIGTSPFAPVRTFCPPEAIIMDIVPIEGFTH